MIFYNQNTYSEELSQAIGYIIMPKQHSHDDDLRTIKIELPLDRSNAFNYCSKRVVLSYVVCNAFNATMSYIRVKKTWSRE